jgi:hypothetical protein
VPAAKPVPTVEAPSAQTSTNSLGNGARTVAAILGTLDNPNNGTPLNLGFGAAPDRPSDLSAVAESKKPHFATRTKDPGDPSADPLWDDPSGPGGGRHKSASGETSEKTWDGTLKEDDYAETCEYAFGKYLLGSNSPVLLKKRVHDLRHRFSSIANFKEALKDDITEAAQGIVSKDVAVLFKGFIAPGQVASHKTQEDADKGGEALLACESAGSEAFTKQLEKFLAESYPDDDQ